MSPVDLIAAAERVLAARSPWIDLIADVYEALGYEVVRAPVTRNGMAWRYRGTVVDVPIYDSGRRWVAMDRDLFDAVGRKLVPPDVGYTVGRGRTRPDEPLGGAVICSIDGEITYAVAEHDREDHALVAAVLRYLAMYRSAGALASAVTTGIEAAHA
jgi:hypothetical protein